VGQEVTRHVRVSCYDCEPGQGAWQPLDDGKPAGVQEPIQQALPDQEDPRIPGLKHYTFAFSVKPKRAGKNSFRVTWPPFCPDNLSESLLTKDFDIKAKGLIEVLPRVAHLREKVTIRVVADRSALPGEELMLQAVNREDADKEPTQIPLKDEGGGIFKGTHEFDHEGEYKISLAREAAGLELEPATVQVAFTLEAPTSLGTIEYGKGNLASWFDSKQEVKVSPAIQLMNKLGYTCRWKARLRYPLTADASRDIFHRDPETATTDQYEETKHLQTRLFAEKAQGAAEPGWLLSGTLENNHTLELSIESKLSKAAEEELYKGESRSHPTLGSTNGMVVEVDLEWYDANGDIVSRRTLFVPFEVKTGAGYSLWVVAALVVVGVVVLGVGGRHYLKRRKRRARVQEPDEGADDMSGAARRAPAAKSKSRFSTLFGDAKETAGPGRTAPAGEEKGPSPKTGDMRKGGSEPPPTPGPGRSGDDLLPDYLRDD
jgi:hypothetical protein